MGQIETVLADIETQLTAVEPTLVFRHGMRDIARLDGPPRVLWVRGGITFGPAEKSTDNPRSLATAICTVVAHIWGADADSTFTLLQNVYAAAYRTAYGSVEVISADLRDNEQMNEEHGSVMLLEMQISIPMPDEIVPTVIITGFLPDLGDAVAGDGVLQCGET